MLDTDLNLDNLDDQDELEQDDELDAGDDDEDLDNPGQQQQKKGNLANALQEERQRRKEYERKATELEERALRAEALFERTSQRQRTVDPEAEAARKAELQTFMLEHPDRFAAQIQQGTRTTMLREMAPMLAPSAERFIQGNPEYKAAYGIPEIREIVDSYIVDQLQSGAVGDLNSLDKAINNVMGAMVIIRGSAGGATGKPAADPGKGKLTTTVGKGASSGARKSFEQVWAEKSKLAKTNRSEYFKWAGSPDGKKVLNAKLQGQF